jgi:hypothetical protein
MSLDLSELQRTIFGIESRMSRLRDDVHRLRRVADAAALQSPAALDLARASLPLHPEIVVRRPDEVVGYLHAHPDLKEIVEEMSAALIEEFRGESSQVELAVYQDPEIEERELTFYVRLAHYDDTLMPRIHRVSERFDDRFPRASGNVCITTDYAPLM